MRQLYLVVIPLLLLLSPVANATGIGFGGGYQLGLPLGGMTGKITTEDESYSATTEMTEGVPFKFGPVGFGAGAVFGIVPMLSAELGFEYHLGYENGSGNVSGTVTNHNEGETEPWAEEISSDDEGEVKLSIMALTVGARFNIPVPNPMFKPYAGGGFLYAISSKLTVVDTEDKVEVDDGYLKGSNPGIYFGAGLNLFVTPVVAINIPVKYRLFFDGSYDAYESNGDKVDYGNVAVDAKFKPTGILTFGVGFEIYPF